MINIDEARELLKQAMLTQGPNFVYNPNSAFGCSYAPRTRGESYIFDMPADHPQFITGCLIGVALSLAGETRHLTSTFTITKLARQYPDMLSDDALHYFEIAQVKQDTGATWGFAYECAEASIL